MERRVIALTIAGLVFLAGGPPAASAPEDGPAPLARVYRTAITRARFDHWMAIAARETGAARTPVEGSKRWVQLRGQVMAFLIDAEWILGESRVQGVHVSGAQVRRALARTQAEIFPAPHDYGRFLRATDQTTSDMLLRVRLDQLAAALRRKAMRPFHSRRAKAAALRAYVADFNRRWYAKTVCDGDFWVGECSAVLPVTAPAPADAPVPG